MQRSLNWFRRLVTRHPFYVAFGGILILAILVGLAIAALILTGGIAAFPILAIAVGAIASSIGAGAIVGATVATAVAVGAVCSLGVLALGALLVGAAVFIAGLKIARSKKVFIPLGSKAQLDAVQDSNLGASNTLKKEVLALYTIAMFSEEQQNQLNSYKNMLVNNNIIGQIITKINTAVAAPATAYSSPVITRIFNQFVLDGPFQVIKTDFLAKMRQAQQQKECLSPQYFDKLVQQIIILTYRHLFDDNGKLRPEIEASILQYLTKQGVSIPTSEPERGIFLAKISIDLLRALSFAAVSVEKGRHPDTEVERTLLTQIHAGYMRHLTNLDSFPGLVQLRAALDVFSASLRNGTREQSILDNAVGQYYIMGYDNKNIPEPSVLAKCFAAVEHVVALEQRMQ